MGERVCPWWVGYFLLCPVRGWFQNPGAVVAPYVREGMTVLEPGPGMGFFTLELARKVGKSGRVVATDIQARMLSALRKRVAKAGVSDRVQTILASPGSLNLPHGLAVDFTLAYWVVHELPEPAKFFAEVVSVSKSGSQVLVCEPKGHVSKEKFNEQMKIAERARLRVVEVKESRRNRTVLFQK